MPDPLPYDGSYRHLFSHPIMVEHLLRGFVPQRWTSRLDFTTLDKCNGHYISDDLRERSDDIVWRVRLNGEDWLYVYLLMEFQSRNDPWMALRLLTYAGLLYQDLVKSDAIRPGQLPPIFPLVLYNGTARWRASQHMDALMAAAPDDLQAYRPRMRYFVLETMRPAAAQADTGGTGNLADALMRLERSPDPTAMRRSIMQLQERLRAPAHDSLRRAFAVYINRVVLRRLVPGHSVPELNDLREIDAMLADRVVEWTEKWKQEGLEQGLEQGLRTGRVRTLRSQLAARFGEPLPARVDERLAQADDAQLQAWTLAVLSAHSLEDMFARTGDEPFA